MSTRFHLFLVVPLLLTCFLVSHSPLLATTIQPESRSGEVSPPPNRRQPTNLSLHTGASNYSCVWQVPNGVVLLCLRPMGNVLRQNNDE